MPQDLVDRRHSLSDASRVRIVYPLLWSRLGREASKEQAVNTAAALARHGNAVTLLLPRGPDDPFLTAAELRRYYAVNGDFDMVQRPSRWAGENLGQSLMWLREVFRDRVFQDAEVLYSRIPAMLCMGQFSPLPFATDHYRPWPDDLPPIRPLVRYTARHSRCLGLVIHSEYAATAYRRSGVPEERLLVAHNAASCVGTGTEKREARLRHGLPAARATAVYAGRINGEKGLDQLLALADLRPEILFLLIGSEREGEIERLAAHRPNIRVLPWMEPAILPSWLAAADVLLIPPSRAPLERFRHCVLPMKLFAYLAAGRPILAPRSPDTAELLRHEETALLVPSEQPQLAATALDRLLDDHALASRLGAAAQRLSERFTWDTRGAKISAFLEEKLMASQRS